MRVVYFGSGTFSVPSLKAILASRHEVARVFTQPARRAGRGGHVRPTAIAAAAAEAGCDVIERADINTDETVERIRRTGAEAICVADFGQMIRQDVLDCTPHGALNLHGSLLPELRGAAPVNWALIRGYKRTGVTTFRIVRKMDAGAIYLKEATEIGADETAEQLKARLAELGAGLVCRTLELLEAGEARPIEQDHSQATFAPLLRKDDGLIDWSAEAEAIRNLVRGTWPWPGARTALRLGDGRELDVTIALAAVAAGPAGGPPGVLDEELAVSTGGGRLRIVEIRPAGKRLMAWESFVNGYHPRPGDRCERIEAT